MSCAECAELRRVLAAQGREVCNVDTVRVVSPACPRCSQRLRQRTAELEADVERLRGVERLPGTPESRLTKLAEQAERLGLVDRHSSRPPEVALIEEIERLRKCLAE